MTLNDSLLLISTMLEKEGKLTLSHDVESAVERIAELEKDLAFYRCCSLSGEVADDLCKPSSIALQEKALKGSNHE